VRKVAIAIPLGLLSFLLLFLVGETAGLFAAFAALTVYFFSCQFLLSRGNSRALRQDWSIMLVLDAILLITVLIMALVEKRDVVMSQGIGILLSCCGGTLAGAFAASRTARRMSVPRPSTRTPAA
jgi:hypothetical protein